ncbi:class I SAM-dependent methyltransferase [Azospira restricta]|uniref:FkbM family methyltransferase n=1 Tax=Azospira restricta TaxID=404405 RepID=A0A974PY23_9RHOO|nr:hypothetical protein [Azospira restricta]QRJ63598.1 FkbM family methyltransferase [Azospira restricta]
MLKTFVKLVGNARPLADLINNGPLSEDGWFLSWHRKESIDAQGKPIPWMTYPAIEFLSRHLPKNIRVLEYGCGNSTYWWAARAASVVSIEHDPDWYARTRPKLPPHCTLKHISLENEGDYARASLAYDHAFEIVVIDGRDRASCLQHCPQALTDDGIIILDDSWREHYQESIRKLLSKGWRRIEFIGYAPISSARGETSIFYRDGNLLGL